MNDLKDKVDKVRRARDLGWRMDAFILLEELDATMTCEAHVVTLAALKARLMHSEWEVQVVIIEVHVVISYLVTHANCAFAVKKF